MPQDSPVERDRDDSDSEFVEIDPTRRYGRYKEVLGRGAFKKVYRAFDELEGMEVAWNQIKLADLLRNPEDMEHLHSEVHLLKTLKHKNIIKCFHSWIDATNEHINFITELFTSGTLRQYRKKHKHVDLRAVKKWSRQILEGLSYLHSHDPPVIHRDLKCDNVFINGNQGEVKIGDLGLATILHQTHLARSVIGTPEFMAPELYEEEYNELVDVYAFGMCLLELVTCEYPYTECANAAQIFKKVTSGKKPASLAKVENPGVRILIEKCIAKASDRLSAKQLLEDPFLQSDDEVENIGNSLNSKPICADTSNVVTMGKYSTAESGLDLTVQGQRKDANTIFLKLQIIDSTGHLRNIHFPFDTEADTSTAVATEMVEELDLTDQDVSTIAEMINSEIRSHIPDWLQKEPTNEKTDGIVANPDDSGREENNFPVPTNKRSFTDETNTQLPTLLLERLPSGRKYWSSSTKPTEENHPTTQLLSKLATHVDAMHNEEGLIIDDGHSEDCLNHLNGHALLAQLEDVSANCGGGGDGNDGGKLVTGVESEIKNVIRELEQLLVRHQKELDELARRHELAVSDLLKELPSNVLERVLRDCKSRFISDSNISDKTKS